MEVRGSVIVGDVESDESVFFTTVKAGFADLDRKLESHEKDGVPRILVRNFRKNTKPFRLHAVFSNFGTVTYLAVKNQLAVLEFSNKDAVDEILRCKFLKVEGSRVHIERLLRFLHVETYQFDLDLHQELQSLNSKETFDAYVSDVCKQSKEESKPKEDKTLCEIIEKAASSKYPHCKAYPFGSRVTHLGLRGCDLDIFLDCGNMYNGEYDQSPREQQALGEDVLKAMLRSSDFARVQKVLNARVPILKFFHVPSGTYGDIAFRHGLGVENSKLLLFLQSLDNRLRPLFLFVKMWAHLQCLRMVSELCHFTSYSLIMMAVFYLQQLPHPVLPPIQMLMNLHKGEQLVISGWPCSFIKDKKCVSKTKNNLSVLALAKGFFKFYQFFHYEWKIICPFLGKAIDRKDMDNISSPDGEIASLFPVYLENLQNEYGEPFRTRCAVCIQDPFEHSHNLTRSVKDEVLMNFISSCGLMYEKLSTFT